MPSLATGAGYKPRPLQIVQRQDSRFDILLVRIGQYLFVGHADL